MKLTLHSINKKYSSFQALNSINLQLLSGEITGILGANGAGKTTLLKILAGYFYPSKGSIYLNDENRDVSPLYLRKHASFLPEGASLPHNRTPLELFNEYYALYHDQISSEEVIRKESRHFQWEKEGDRKIRHLSKGYRQRVGLSLSFIKGSPMILLDEPFSGLDPTYVKELRGLMKEKKEGRIILFSSHVLQEIYALSDRIIIFSRGKVMGDYGKTDFSSWEDLENVYNQLCGELND
jgi:ABC-2 type transport system ATP-binding protein